MRLTSCWLIASSCSFVSCDWRLRTAVLFWTNGAWMRWSAPVLPDPSKLHFMLLVRYDWRRLFWKKLGAPYLSDCPTSLCLFYFDARQTYTQSRRTVELSCPTVEISRGALNWTGVYEWFIQRYWAAGLCLDVLKMLKPLSAAVPEPWTTEGSMEPRSLL